MTPTKGCGLCENFNLWGFRVWPEYFGKMVTVLITTTENKMWFGGSSNGGAGRSTSLEQSVSATGSLAQRC
ncbi:hypothetical protein RRG08_051416 [Elysia crispata]|uniref:Uncharacterized protein n=1 Tax=Elysia crispata TaxID=231223 RepID=A0AAE1E9F0_9GAST|nr:hypothetical protein RRG08_051416 [Elysia crispata]